MPNRRMALLTWPMMRKSSPAPSSLTTISGYLAAIVQHAPLCWWGQVGAAIIRDMRQVGVRSLPPAISKPVLLRSELHVLRARLNGGIRNKAARGELRRGLPVGFVWGEADGEVLFHPDEAVVTAIRSIFAGFAEL